jgi:general secretion pathway protein L
MRYDLAAQWEAFLLWWKEGLLACLPSSLQQALKKRPASLIVQIRAREVSFLYEEGGESREMDCFPLEMLLNGDFRERGAAFLGDAEGVVLRLPAEQGLIKELSLPLVAETNLRQVVGFEIDRLTPFAAGQLYYDVAKLERQADLKRIRIVLVAVPRTAVDPWLNRLAELGLEADGVTLTGEDCGINLLPPERRPQRHRLAQRLSWSLMSLVAALLALAALLPLWQQRSLAVALLPKVAAAQQEAEQILVLRKQLEEASESSHFLFQKRRESVSVMDLLKELTAVLPDDTWLEQLEINGNEIRLQGQSSQASALIGLVEGSKWLHGATFLAPVIADRGSGKERFYLSAQIIAGESGRP